MKRITFSVAIVATNDCFAAIPRRIISHSLSVPKISKGGNVRSFGQTLRSGESRSQSRGFPNHPSALGSDNAGTNFRTDRSITENPCSTYLPSRGRPNRGSNHLSSPARGDGDYFRFLAFFFAAGFFAAFFFFAAIVTSLTRVE